MSESKWVGGVAKLNQCHAFDVTVAPGLVDSIFAYKLLRLAVGAGTTKRIKAYGYGLKSTTQWHNHAVALKVPWHATRCECD